MENIQRKERLKTAEQKDTANEIAKALPHGQHLAILPQSANGLTAIVKQAYRTVKAPPQNRTHQILPPAECVQPPAGTGFSKNLQRRRSF